MKHEEIREKALQFLMTQKGGVISTLSGDQPQSAFIFYDADEDFSIYFPTPVTTRKNKNIEQHKKVAFNVSTIKPPQTIQIEGVVEEVEDGAVAENSLGNYLDTATYGLKNHPPISKLEPEKGVKLYRIKPTWVKWSDYSDRHSKFQSGASVILVGEEHTEH